MFRCANDECSSTIKPGEKPVQVTNKIRTVGYLVNGELIGTGRETAQEVLLCRTCWEIAQGLDLMADVVGHKVIDQQKHKRTGRLLRVDVMEEA